MGIALLSVLTASIGAKEPRVAARLIINGFAGFAVITVINRLGNSLYIGANPFTIGMISIFGIPGFVSVAALSYFL